MGWSAAFEGDDALTVPERPEPSAWARAQRAVRRSLPLRIALVILLVGLVGGAVYAGAASTRQPRPIYASAAMGNVIISTQASGVIQTTTYTADFPVDGTLRTIDVSVGQPVHQGQTLATLNPAPFQSALSAAQSVSAAAQQSVSAAQTAQDQAQSASGSARDALSAAQSTVDTACAAQPPDPDACNAAKTALAQAQAQADAGRARLAAAQAQLAQAQTSLAQAQGQAQVAQAQLDAITLASPHDGVVMTINGRVGGKPGATPNGHGAFIVLADTNQPTLTALIRYPTVRAVQVGDMATLQAPQATQRAFSASVTGVSPIGQGSGATLSYPVYLTVMPNSLRGTTLLQGMSATVRIITAARYHVIVVPRAAVVYARESAPASGAGALTKQQVATALATARGMAQQVAESGFDTARDPITPYYLVGFTHGQYIPIPVVLGLTDGRTQEVVAGLMVKDQVVTGQRSPFGF